mmetsp:Transcript_72657/g.160433  ORF Transcript_72657/g.160433 Transcript_72657/m.160433 type:complete len:222 (-) Transcript_72657:9-674(-)
MAWATWELPSANVPKVKAASYFVQSPPSRSRATSSGKAPSASTANWIFSSPYATIPKPLAAFRFLSSSAFGSFRTWTCSRISISSLVSSGNRFRAFRAKSLPHFTVSSSLGSSAKASRASRPPQATMVLATCLSFANTYRTSAACPFAKSSPSLSSSTSGGTPPAHSTAKRFSGLSARFSKDRAAFAFSALLESLSFRIRICCWIFAKSSLAMALSVAVSN